MYKATEIRSNMDALGAADLLAIVIEQDDMAGLEDYGVDFHTPAGITQQVATMYRKAGTVVGAHYHKPVLRQVRYTQEVLIVLFGRMRVDFYDGEGTKVTSRIITPYNICLLCGGGHGVEFLEDTELIEVKQGPYSGSGDDKCFFEPKLTQAVMEAAAKLNDGCNCFPSPTLGHAKSCPAYKE